jgi:outer membrane protein OmpA-like peptidoglycan-associated protein
MRWAAALALAWVSAVARAEDVELRAHAVALKGESPSLQLKANRAVRTAAFILKRSDGKELRLQVGALRKGQVRKVLLEQPRGKFHYQGELSVHFVGEEFPVSLPVSLDVVVGSPVALALAEGGLQLADNRVLVTMNGEARTVRHTVYADDGKVLDRGETRFEGAAEGVPLTVAWKNPEGRKVLRLDLVGEDTASVITPTLQLVPWSLDIPHEDVLFPTGEHTLPAAEKAKVQAVVGPIADAVRRYGAVVDVSLYVSGYTDTVGDQQSNQQLSLARAQSIARALRAAGVRCPIFFGGYGEWRPARRTADNADEPLNRRAVYTLSAEPPRPPPSGGWRPL